MEELINTAVQQYAEAHSTPEAALLQQVAAYTQATHPKAHMLSGALQGKFLEMISCMLRPMRILELGTFTGYSALCLAKGLPPGGQLHTIELRAADAATAQRFFNQSGFASQIQLHIGEALPLIDELNETWDLVFIDADKENYTAYFNRVLPKLRPGGFILADNTLFHGQVLAAEIRGKNARAIHAFNQMLAARGDVEQVLLPLRDGLTLIRKL